MGHRFGIAPARPVARAIAIATATTMLTALIGTGAFAQTPPAPPAPKAPAKPAPKAAPKAPAVEHAPAPAQQPSGNEQVQLIWSPWTKFCLKGQDAGAKQVCFTGKDGRVESGQPIVAAVLIEPEGEPKKILRVTLPLGMQLIHGTRVIVDQNQPMTAPYVICFTNGCMADYEANHDLIGKLKKGAYRNSLTMDGYDRPLTLDAEMTIGEDGIHVDYAGTSPASAFGINVVLNYTTAYTAFWVKCLVSTEVPSNAGSFAPLPVTEPDGFLLNAQRPSAVAGSPTVRYLLPDDRAFFAVYLR